MEAKGLLWTTECLQGGAALPFLDELARLRIEVFRDWPYLYEGSMEYERKFLQTYAEAPDSLLVLARSGEEVIGVSTGIPLVSETPEVLRPFVEAGIDPATVFYFGESVLRKSFRGHGIGVRFFEERENHALLLPGIEWCAFCAVIRPDDHPARPPGHQPLDDFWRHRGYGPTGMTTIFSWRDVGDTAESEKPMRFWMKRIRKHGRPEQEPT